MQPRFVLKSSAQQRSRDGFLQEVRCGEKGLRKRVQHCQEKQRLPNEIKVNERDEHVTEAAQIAW